MKSPTGGLHGWRSAAVWLVVVADLASMTASLAFIPERPDLPLWAMAIFILMVASFGLVGALVATRQPRNAIGWIFWSAAIVVTFAAAGDAYASRSVAAFDGDLPGTVMVAWLSGAGLIPAFATVVVFVPLLFPDGRLLSPRWRWVVWFAIVAIIVGPVPPAFQPGPLPNYPTIANPLGIAVIESLSGAIGLANVLGLAIGLPVAIASLVLRYRRGSPIEREQLKWFAAAAAMTAAGFALSALPDRVLANVGWLVGIVGLSLMPVAIGIAILRYRLYEIDLIINRTLVYVPATAIVAGIYTASIALSQRVFVALTGQKSDGAIVATTLIVVMLFTPIKNALQAIVDRRFKEVREPTAPLAAFAALFDNRVWPPDPVASLRRLLEVSVAALGATGGSVSLAGRPVAHFGDGASEASLAVEAGDGAAHVSITIGTRPGGRPYSDDERRAVEPAVEAVARALAARLP